MKSPGVQIDIDREKGIIRVGLEGPHTVRTIVEATRSIAHLPEMHRLWDVRNARLDELDFTAMVGMADAMASLNPVDPSVRVAVLAARDVEFGISRMFEILFEARGPGTITVFRTLEEAQAWLAEATTD